MGQVVSCRPRAFLRRHLNIVTGTRANHTIDAFALFWTLRLIAGTFVFDLRPYLTDNYRRIGYHAINVVFAYLPIVYNLAAIQPRWLSG